MRLSGFNIYTYDLPLTNPISVSGHTLNSRKGIIIRLTSEEGKEGFGETAPLPYRSEESILESIAQLKGLQGKFSRVVLPEHMEKLDGTFSKWLDIYKLSPSVRFGFETAVLNLIADTKNKQLNHL